MLAWSDCSGFLAGWLHFVSLFGWPAHFGWFGWLVGWLPGLVWLVWQAWFALLDRFAWRDWSGSFGWLAGLAWLLWIAGCLAG